jgi:hypothetical protein
MSSIQIFLVWEEKHSSPKEVRIVNLVKKLFPSNINPVCTLKWQYFLTLSHSADVPSAIRMNIHIHPLVEIYPMYYYTK